MKKIILIIIITVISIFYISIFIKNLGNEKYSIIKDNYSVNEIISIMDYNSFICNWKLVYKWKIVNSSIHNTKISEKYKIDDIIIIMKNIDLHCIWNFIINWDIDYINKEDYNKIEFSN